MKGYDFHPDAEADLDDIWHFIAEDNLAAADRVIEAIDAAVQALVPFPYQGLRRTDLTSRPLRFIIVGKYLIAHAPDQSPLWVIAVMHGHRSPETMSAILQSRQ